MRVIQAGERIGPSLLPVFTEHSCRLLISADTSSNSQTLRQIEIKATARKGTHKRVLTNIRIISLAFDEFHCQAIRPRLGGGSNRSLRFLILNAVSASP
jgi:hypothetical protein